MAPADNGVWLPVHLYEAMALCYYGDGPRAHDEGSSGVGGSHELDGVIEAVGDLDPEDDGDFQGAPGPLGGLTIKGGGIRRGGDD